MKIFITIPSFAVHGGIRVILEWANRLTKWHEVYLYSLTRESCGWFEIDQSVKITFSPDMTGMDCLIITSPHTIHLQHNTTAPKKIFVFAQMAEHLFQPGNQKWINQCREFYNSPHPMFSISQWNIKEFQRMGRTGTTHYIGNGVNLDHFPISNKPKDGKTILVEGWECNNPSKDPDYIAARVAQAMKGQGYYIIAYSQQPLKKYKNVPDEYYQLPTLEKLNELYERATILIKASRYDARSCAPMEAMTKGTVTARAIGKGDDDLIQHENCIRVGYDFRALHGAAIVLMLKKEGLPVLKEGREDYAKNCLEYVQKYNWDYWMEKINDILCKD